MMESSRFGVGGWGRLAIYKVSEGTPLQCLEWLLPSHPIPTAFTVLLNTTLPPSRLLMNVFVNARLPKCWGFTIAIVHLAKLKD